MEELFLYQNKILKTVTDQWYRSAFNAIDWNQRLFGIKGLRGVGKTTLLLQYIKFHYPEKENALYVSADNPWFYDNGLYELISDFDKLGGKLLVIDEIHKYPGWPSELKAGYDAHPYMQFIFSASSDFDILKAEADLSRRATVNLLPGLSFREFLEFRHGIQFPSLILTEILENATELSKDFNEKARPLPLFKEYIRNGYFPFLKNESAVATKLKLSAIINAVLENDMAYIQNYSPSNIQKIKKLLGDVAGSAPFTPNVSKIADKLNVGRNSIYNYLKHLEDAHILNLTHKTGRGISVLQKPDKIYFENTNLALALNENADIGALRETFFVNQLRNAGHQIHLAKKGDFVIDDSITVQTGGKNKSGKQITDLEQAYIAKDDIEYAFQNRIPIWIFGLLY
ncbi:ATP-binding protein [Rhodohalobacter sp.]|uniref:ATP-binding protein n=1 Tax=Rhodohalobacter sp. TaxID=1974210 RepID=UPI002ACD7405|nr:AAA family ATPase [Rhodohalobacter sp.]MDZ7755512.1 AAA family ATPase [Rhodohalobacter sp.]